MIRILVFMRTAVELHCRRTFGICSFLIQHLFQVLGFRIQDTKNKQAAAYTGKDEES
jgi:hypothetical protein